MNPKKEPFKPVKEPFKEGPKSAKEPYTSAKELSERALLETCPIEIGQCVLQCVSPATHTALLEKNTTKIGLFWQRPVNMFLQTYY